MNLTELIMPKPKPARAALLRILLLTGFLAALTANTFAQTRPVIVNLAMLDGQEITPDNVFNYTIQSPISATVQATIKGKLTYRASGLSFTYTFPYTLRPGMNMIESAQVHPQWTYSSSAFRELFQDYKKLPAGTYEYCVEVNPVSPGGELIPEVGGSDCLYQKPNEVFLINLVDPDNNAKLHEDFPVFSWMVNYPFVSALTYRVRVAEIKEGQNNTTAVNRNNAWYQESNLTGLSVSYPVYAKPLEKFQPYAWTVDSYYKGILLGGAEAWRFTIVDDSLMKSLPHESFFVDIRKEHNATNYYAVGVIKLKYILDEGMEEALSIDLTDKKGKQVKINTEALKAVLGDNRFEIDLRDAHLGNLEVYDLLVKNSSGQEYHLPIKYVNPDFLK